MMENTSKKVYFFVREEVIQSKIKRTFISVLGEIIRLDEISMIKRPELNVNFEEHNIIYGPDASFEIICRGFPDRCFRIKLESMKEAEEVQKMVVNLFEKGEK